MCLDTGRVGYLFQICVRVKDKLKQLYDGSYGDWRGGRGRQFAWLFRCNVWSLPTSDLILPLRLSHLLL